MTQVATRDTPAEDEITPEKAPFAAPEWLCKVAGPALIVVCVVVALRGFIFRPFLTDQHPDILAFWLPRYCFLGRSLGSLHLPLWNSLQTAGAPYASDAQSGWLYLPAMAASTVLKCGANVRALVVFNPLLAGLALYWFLRKEGVYRTAATAGALAYAMIMAQSAVAISLPFAGTLAWTPLVLVSASGYQQTKHWPARLLWLGLAALAWGQVASAHMSHGLVMCSVIVLVYMAARAARAVRYHEHSLWGEIGLVLLFFAFLPAANFAILLPRLALIPRTSLRGGYGSLGVQLTQASGINERPITDGGVWSGWPFALASTPGAFAGATVLIAVPLALRTYGKRYLAAAFGACAVISYVLTLNILVGASWFQNLVLKLPFGDVYLHNPGRLRYTMFLIVPVLGALGIQGLIERPIPWRRALMWLAAGIGAFLILPLLLGAHSTRLTWMAIGIVVTVPVLVALGRQRRWARWGVPAVVALELVSGALYSSTYSGGTVFFGLESAEQNNLIAGPLRWPDISTDAYLAPGRIAQFLADHRGRYDTWVLPAASFEKGYLFTQDEHFWPALENGRGLLFELDDVLGYSPIQLARYWSYVRATNRLKLFYNASVLANPSLEDARLMNVRYLITSSATPPPIPATRIMSEGAFTLYEVQGWQQRASVVPDWTEVSGGSEALARVQESGFNPGQEAVVEGAPGITPTAGAPPGTAAYTEISPEDVRVNVNAAVPSLAVVRNAWDEGWSATVDGEPASVLVTDYFIQGVPVPEGSHVVRLVYRDPNIGRGLLGSAAVWSGWLMALLAATVLSHRRSRRLREAAVSNPT